MKYEPCIRKCKFRDNNKCELYGVKLKKKVIPDPYDSGFVEYWCKCEECLEKEISCSIDDKIMEVYSFYHAFTQEMNILFSELDSMIQRRKDIYKGDE
jgi:hypothetical protein